MIILSFFLSLNSNHSNNLEIPMPKLHHPDTGHFVSRAKLIAFYTAEELTRRGMGEFILPPRAFLPEHMDVVDVAWVAVDAIVPL